MVRILQAIVRFYSLAISPWLGQKCRYHPSCSCYAHQALEKHGALKGIYLIFMRIFSCHPWSKKKYNDPVPERFAWRDILGYKRKR